MRARPVASPARRLVRDVTVAGASVGVIALLVLYAIAAPDVSMSAKVGAVVPLPGQSAVVVGRVLGADGGGVKGARIEARRAGALAGSAVSSRSGAFRVALPDRCAFYDVLIRAHASGATVTAMVRHQRLCAGDALPVDARIATQGQFLWVPGPR